MKSVSSSSNGDYTLFGCSVLDKTVFWLSALLRLEATLLGQLKNSVYGERTSMLIIEANPETMTLDLGSNRCGSADQLKSVSADSR